MKILWICSFLCTSLLVQAEQYTDVRSSKQRIDGVLEHWSNVCFRWYNGQSAYSDPSSSDDESEYLSLSKRKQKYRDDFCGKIDKKSFDAFKKEVTFETSPFLKVFDVKKYTQAVENLMVNEKTAEPGLFLYQAHYTKSANLYDFMNRVRHFLECDNAEENAHLYENRLTKIFMKDEKPMDQNPIKFWGSLTSKTPSELAKIFQQQVLSKALTNFDGFPANLALLSFATSITSSAMGESPLYFLASDTVSVDPTYDGFGIVNFIMGDILKEFTRTDVTVDALHDGIDLSRLQRIDNRRILQFFLPSQKESEWKDLGWWSSSHGSIHIDPRSHTSKTLQDLKNAIVDISEIQDDYGYLGIIEPTSKEPESPFLAREDSFSFVGEKRPLVKHIQVNGQSTTIPMAYRFQARLPMNSKMVSDYLEKNGPLHDESLSSASSTEQKELKDGIEMMARRFVCALSGQAQYGGNGWEKTAPSSNVWEKVQEAYPFFNGKRVMAGVCETHLLNRQKPSIKKVDKPIPHYRFPTKNSEIRQRAPIKRME